MPDIPFVGGAYRGRSGPQNSQSCQNLYPVMSKDGKVVKALYGTPGLTPWTTTPGVDANLRFTGTLERKAKYLNDNMTQNGSLNMSGELEWQTLCETRTVVIAYTTEQMYLNGVQNLSASGGIRPYTWSIQSGGGSCSESTGDATTYTAPAINPSCMYNATIRCTDYCGNYDEIHVAITNETVNEAGAYFELWFESSETCTFNTLWWKSKLCDGDDDAEGPQVCNICISGGIGKCCMGHWDACGSSTPPCTGACECNEAQLVLACKHGQNSPGYDGNCKNVPGHCTPGNYDHRDPYDLEQGCCPRSLFYGGDTE